jgi:hypothetical protein
MSSLHPTVGRVVHYHPITVETVSGNRRPQTTPLAATIAFVHSETMINIGYIETDGRPHSATSVHFVGPDQEAPSDRAYCCWPPRA